jgi:N-methylhydantoinase B/oxoprolinase/acetone carboxylase alpha subunit
MKISPQSTLSSVIELSNFSQSVTAIGEVDTGTGNTEIPVGVFIDPTSGKLNLGLTRTESDSSVNLNGVYSGVFGTQIKYFEEELVTSDEALTAEGFKELKEKYPDLDAEGKVVQPSVTNDVLSIPTEPPQTLYSYISNPPFSTTVQYRVTVYYNVFSTSVNSMTREEHEQGVIRDNIRSSTFTVSQTVNFDESVPYNTIKAYYPDA